jgi:hypothetical protein
MKKPIRTCLAFLFVLAPAIAMAKSPPSPSLPCDLPGEDSETYLSVNALPPAIKQALVNEQGDGKVVDMVPRDAGFQETDLIESPDGPLSFHRFIQAPIQERAGISGLRLAGSDFTTA